MTTTIVLCIPVKDGSSTSETFATLEDARQFAIKNDGRLFHLLDNRWAFENYGKRSAEQIER